jgi:hypothetical protein
MVEIFGALRTNHKAFFQLTPDAHAIRASQKLCVWWQEMPGQPAIEIFAERSTFACAWRT